MTSHTVPSQIIGGAEPLAEPSALAEMAPKASVPDAWDDDDWEAQVDKLTAEDHVQPKPQQPPLSKAERLTQHAETNRKLWESA